MKIWSKLLTKKNKLNNKLNKTPVILKRKKRLKLYYKYLQNDLKIKYHSTL